MQYTVIFLSFVFYKKFKFSVQLFLLFYFSYFFAQNMDCAKAVLTYVLEHKEEN